MIKKLKLRESNADAISKVIRSQVVRDKLNEFRDNFYGDGTYAEKFGNDVTYHDITDVKCTIDDVWTEVLGNPGIWDIICHADIKWDWDEDTDTVGTQESFSFYYDPATDTIVDDADIHTMEQDMTSLVGESRVRRRRSSLTESLKKPYVDWDKLVRAENSGINKKKAKDFSTTYRLNTDFDLGNAGEVYRWYIEDNLLADLIENQNFWVAEDGNVYIPKGTEFTFYFRPDDDGRDLYLYLLNVPELNSEPEQLWLDRYYNSDSWAYELINAATPLDKGQYFGESRTRGNYRNLRRR